MLDLLFPEISATAGNYSDGVVIGNIVRSNVVGAFTSSVILDTIYALRKESVVSGENVGDQFLDVSANAIGNVVNGFSALSGLELWLSSIKDICEIYVQIDTPGVYTGTMSVQESIDGETLVDVGNLVDGSDGLRASAGIYKISFDDNDNRKAISPFFGATKRKYIVISRSLTSSPQTPLLRRLWLACSDNSKEYLDFTDAENQDLADPIDQSFVDLTVIPNIDADTNLGFSGLTMGFDRTDYRAVDNTSIVPIHEYYASDETWKPLQNVVDLSNFHTIGPTNYGDPTVLTKVRWTVPTDWTAKPLTFAPSTTPVTAYWYRDRMVSIGTYTLYATPLWRARSLSFGSSLAYGIFHAKASSYSYVTFEIGIASTTDMIVSFVNAITGQARSVTIPQNTSSSGSVTGGRLDFVTPLEIGAGQHLLISHISGSGNLQDVQLRIG